MARPARLALLASTLALLCCAACGSPDDTAASTAANDGARWHVRDRPHWDTWGPSQKEYVALAIPEARNASEDRTSGTYRRLTLNVLASGNVLFKGKEWPLETGVAEERREALAAIRDTLALLLAGPDLRGEDGASLVPVMLHAARGVSWSLIADLLGILRRPDVRIRRLQIAVRQASRTFAAQRGGGDHRLDVLMSSADAGAEGAGPFDVRLSGAATEAGPVVRLSAVGRTWSFGEGEADFEDEAFLRRANAVWHEVEEALASAAPDAGPARIRVEDEGAVVPLAYVVTTLDLLLGLGVHDVAFPDLDLRLELADPVTTPPAELEDDPILTPWTLAACALAVLLAFAITFLPLRRKPSP